MMQQPAINALGAESSNCSVTSTSDAKAENHALAAVDTRALHAQHIHAQVWQHLLLQMQIGGAAAMGVISIQGAGNQSTSATFIYM
jgi:hypothetical protein